MLRAISRGFRSTDNAKIDGRLLVDGEEVAQESLNRKGYVVSAFQDQWNAATGKLLDDVQGFANAHNSPSYSGDDPIAVVLDEPTCGLDAWGLAQLNDSIERISQRSGVVMAAHDAGFLLRHANRVVHLVHGEVAFSGGVDFLLSESEEVPQETYEFIEKSLAVKGHTPLSTIHCSM